MPDDIDLDGALDELYGVAVKDFVPTRKSLADDLRAAGDPAGAKQLAAARRPTTAAWALNRLAREHPELVDEVLERSAELRSIQAQASSGTAGDLRQASADRRNALTAAADAAVALAAEIATNPEAHRDSIAATLEAASVDETIGAAVRAGRLVREVVGAVGFPEIASLTLVESPKRGARRREPAATDDAAVEDAGMADAQAALADAEAEARRTRQRASELAVTAGEAEQRVDERAGELEAAQAALRDAKAEVREAHAELNRAERAATIAERAVEKARTRLG